MERCHILRCLRLILLKASSSAASLRNAFTTFMLFSTSSTTENMVESWPWMRREYFLILRPIKFIVSENSGKTMMEYKNSRVLSMIAITI